MSEKEYDRLASEILQNQRFRITLFTFSITTTAAIIGLTVKRTDMSGILVSVVAVYTVLIPSIMLINHYTRSVNYISEYLNIFHTELWMANFDKLNEEILPGSTEISRSHKLMHLFGAYSTEKSFLYAYGFLNIFIFLYGLLMIPKKNEFLCILIIIFLFCFTYFIMWAFRPISKKEYRQLWQQTKDEYQNL